MGPAQSGHSSGRPGSSRAWSNELLVSSTSFEYSQGQLTWRKEFVARSGHTKRLLTIVDVGRLGLVSLRRSQ